MDLLQKTTESNMKSQLLVFLSLFCFWTVISEQMPKSINTEEGLPEDVLRMIAQADIRSINDLEDLLGIEAKDSPGFKPMYKIEYSKPAGCKTRIVTVEVPRYKVDPTSVGFLLWPSCVEIKRCSGCCNTKTYQCIPVHAYYKPFQIAKVTYRYGRNELTIHTVSIREHVSCNCTELARHQPRFPPKYYRQTTDNN
ncbi:platelet-derived growth factor subunit A-like isoform X2 [Chiloscyllium plagiosum]|uniref:platelet-derived growth factor subunit A-like isoform X2 n=1 Tax=Chiloscyllium plagiosum TaxID=36176 RepID=UPI001CB7CC68|nr:platelet-derived growth factor subunit A-like isoform X2 [Chiloscyllium plagiosum]